MFFDLKQFVDAQGSLRIMTILNHRLGLGSNQSWIKSGDVKLGFRTVGLALRKISAQALKSGILLMTWSKASDILVCVAYKLST